MTGQELLGGRYELRGLLGRGGMAEVHDGWDTRLHRAVAIKLLHPALSAQPDIRSRFVAEARAAGGLTHPNIVAVHDFGEHNGFPFMVMERLSGDTLEQELGHGPLAANRVRAIMDDVLTALAVAHSAGILHRDIKPGNVLWSPEAMKLADFGIAKTFGTAHTMAGQLFGTMAYMSPERLAGTSATASDDLYAVGVVGYEAATGGLPFPQSDPLALAAAVMGGSVAPLGSARPDIDTALAATIDQAMTRDPRLRFVSAEDMRVTLHGGRAAQTATYAVGSQPRRAATKLFTEPVPHAAADAYFVTPHARRRGLSRTKKILLVSAVLLALIVAVVAIALDPSSQQTPAPAVSSTTAAPTTVAPLPPTIATSVEPPPSQRGNGKHKHGD